MNPAQQLTQQVIAEQARQIDEAILLAIQKHLPEFSRETIGDYAHRIQIIQRDGQPGERLYLDFGTAEETLLLTIGPVEIEHTGETVRFYQTITP